MLNFAAEFITVVVLKKDVLNSAFMMTTATFNMLANFTLVILMLNTKKRTMYSRRMNLEDEYLLANETAAIRSPMASARNRLKLKIRFQAKIKFENNQNVVQFRTEIDSSHGEIKVLKTVEEFDELQNIVLE